MFQCTLAHNSNMTFSAAPEWDFFSEIGKQNYERALRMYPGQVVIDLAVLKNNMERLVQRVKVSNDTTQVMGVIKADGYGHGVLASALAALAGGATWLGSAQPREALMIRKAGIGVDRCRILVWMYSARSAPLEDLIAHDIDISVGSSADIYKVAKAAESIGKKARVHVEAETGFGRNGFTLPSFDKALTDLKDASARGFLAVVGLWSHFAVADMPQVEEFVEMTNQQIAVFDEFTSRMRMSGIEPEIRHLANTAATLTRPDVYYDLTRPGIGFYGYEPDPSMGDGSAYGLRPAMTLQAQLGTVKNLSSGHGISYGRTYVTEEDTSSAIMPLGYADGIHRSASGTDGSFGSDNHLGGPVRIMTKQGPKLVRVSGRVCMDQCILDLHARADNLGVQEGDTVVVFGPGRGERFVEPTVDDWARSARTISYEIFACLRNRIPRLYLHAQKVLSDDDLQLLDPFSIL